MAFDDEPATVVLMDVYLEKSGDVNDINKDRLHQLYGEWNFEN